MKKSILLYIAICLMLLITSCGEKLNDDYEYEAIKAELSISQTSLSVDASEQTQKVQITSNSYWTATTNASWIYLETSKGKGNSAMSVKFEANPSVTGDRNGEINITDGIHLHTITVIQGKATPVISVSKNSLDFAYSGGSSSISVESNVDWTTTSDANWCKLSTTSSKIIVTVQSNDSYSPRTANITLKNALVSNPPVIQVSQSAPQEPTVGALTISDITKTTANCKFTYNSSDLSVIRTGICYSATESDPTISNQTIYSSVSAYSGTASYSITGLTQNTTYYVRPYVETSIGPTYGNTVQFTTAKIISPEEGDNPTPNY